MTEPANSSVLASIANPLSLLDSTSEQLGFLRRVVLAEFSAHAAMRKAAHDLVVNGLDEQAASQSVFGTAAIFFARECLARLHQIVREGMHSGEKPRQSTEAFLVTVEAELLAAELRARDLWLLIAATAEVRTTAAEVWSLAREVSMSVLGAELVVLGSEPVVVGRSGESVSAFESIKQQLTALLHEASPFSSVDATEQICTQLGVD